MTDREKVINIYANCILNDKQCCSGCYTGGPGLGIACRQQVLTDALYLLKEQDKRYAMMVVDWLREIAYNNYLDSSHMTFWDAILDIRERAQKGLENYFRDYDSDIKQQEGR